MLLINSLYFPKLQLVTNGYISHSNIDNSLYHQRRKMQFNLDMFYKHLRLIVLYGER